MFDTPVLKELAAHCTFIDVKNDTEVAFLVRVSRLPHMPASAVQKRLWFVQQLLPTSAAYHMPLGLKFTGDVNIAVLGSAINVLVARHEILRTNFTQVEGELMQSIHAEREICVGIHQNSESDEQRLSVYKELIAKPFDFSEGPLI